MPRSAWYTLGFAAVICLVCSVLVTSAAVTLEPRQDVNRALDKQKNVLEAAGLKEAGEKLSAEEVEERFASFEAVVVDLTTGEEDPVAVAADIDQRKMSKNPATSFEVERNRALVKRVPKQAVVFKLRDEQGELEMVILPVEGAGLWGTLYGFIALGPDLNTVKGITFYEHKETPGLGGEVDNPLWKARWPDRKIFDEAGNLKLTVIKGPAPSAEEAPFEVDGLSGATITSRGVTALVHFWLGEDGFGKYLESIAKERRTA